MSETEDVSRGLRALADFLDAHPDLPVPWFVEAKAPTAGEGDAGHRAEVDRIAAILGVPVDDRGSHYSTERDFGGSVKYAAVAITRAHMDAYSAHMESWHERGRDQ